MAPVKVIFGDVPPKHTAVVPDINAVGNGFTVITAEPVWGKMQLLLSLTLTNE